MNIIKWKEYKKIGTGKEITKAKLLHRKVDIY